MKFDEAQINCCIGRNLKRWRLKRSLTLVQVAEVLQVSWQQVQKYESGADRLSAARLYIIKHYLNMPYENFFRV